MVVFAVGKQLILYKEMLFLEELFSPLGNTTITLRDSSTYLFYEKTFPQHFCPKERPSKNTLKEQKQFLRTWFHFLGEPFTYKNHLEKTLEMVKTFGFGIFHL
jgi:hypothetical protein